MYLPKANAQTIALILRKEILTRWGVLDFILSDRGTKFVSSLFREFCSKWNVEQKFFQESRTQESFKNPQMRIQNSGNFKAYDSLFSSCGECDYFLTNFNHMNYLKLTNQETDKG